MSPTGDPAAASRRLAVFAVSIGAPAVAAALLLPWLLGHRGAGALQQANAAAGAVASRQAAEAALIDGAQGPPRAEEERPKAPEGPTPEQIERAHDAQVALGRAQRGWERAATLAPRAEAPDAAGTTTVPFDGFAVSVESEPAGARVLLDGRPLGETPVLSSVTCTPGTALALVVEKAPLPPRRVALTCRADVLVKLSIRLGR